MSFIKFEGPRPACRTLDSLADDLGNPIIEAINKTSLSTEESTMLTVSIETILTEVFNSEKYLSVRQYIYDLSRNQKDAS